jgi:hypothetical protein
MARAHPLGNDIVVVCQSLLVASLEQDWASSFGGSMISPNVSIAAIKARAGEQENETAIYRSILETQPQI